MSLAPGTIIRHPDPAATVLVGRLTTRGVEGVYGLRGPVIVTAQLAADDRRHIDAGDYMVTTGGSLDLYRLAASVAEGWEVVPSASEVTLRQRVAELEAEMVRIRAETVTVTLRREHVPEAPRPFGGRNEGDRCYCSPAGHLRQQPFAEGTSYYLQCPLCHAGYNEAGQHLCPTCGVFDGRWDPGTDHDPRSTCRKCGNFQPGWGSR